MSWKERVSSWRKEFLDHKLLIGISLIVLIFSLIINHYTGKYAAEKASFFVTDIILDNIVPINLTPVFIYGYIAVIVVFLFYPLFFKVRKLHTAIGQFSLLIAVRGIFISMTHLRVVPTAIKIVWPWIFSNLAFQNDLFFSGHTAVPFMGFLIFKGKVRYFFLVMSIVLASTALLMHLHYTIDVFAAFFITYGVYKIGNYLFKEK